MKKKTIGKQLLAWVLAGAMMPQSSIAYAAETAASALARKKIYCPLASGERSDKSRRRRKGYFGGQAEYEKIQS